MLTKIAAFPFVMLVWSVGAFAQGTAGLGAVSGTVRDVSSAVIPGATVVLSNESKGIKRTMQTTAAGVFAAPALVPASGYSLTVTSAGFATWEAKDFQVEEGFDKIREIGTALLAARRRP
jgi:Carboxypeptidase regulatory-like domain